MRAIAFGRYHERRGSTWSGPIPARGTGECRTSLANATAHAVATVVDIAMDEVFREDLRCDTGKRLLIGGC
jgi:hypothetical protein